jgi:hypothetical protein
LVEKKRLLLFFVLNLVLTITCNITFKMEANALQPWPLFLTFLNPLLMTTPLAVPVFWYAFISSNPLPPDVVNFPKWRFVALGTFKGFFLLCNSHQDLWT